ncbi:6,7-dimethyl-8-ribityllumazine synthase [bacterium]|nr:6,7-dimethyl-8-ribityllumazine synthase [candidate division CSSED10-310 bacterium]
MKVIEGELKGAGCKIGVVVSRFNSFITAKLVDGARDALLRHEVKEEDIHLVYVPGAFEIPRIAKRLVEKEAYDAVICLGAVIRGETPHFDYVAAEVSKGVAAVGLESGVPVVFGVLTTDTVDQAVDRAGAKSGNKGFDAALAALELIQLFKKI